MPELDDLTKANIVQMILDGKTENALEKLSEFYRVETHHITKEDLAALVLKS